MASLWVEIAPGIAINQITDICLKQSPIPPYPYPYDCDGTVNILDLGSGPDGWACPAIPSREPLRRRS